MRRPTQIISRLVRRLLLRDESGSAMTEFVIGLPIFILIFSGMGALHKLNSEALAVRMEVNADLWANGNSTFTNMVPLIGAATSIGSVSDIFTNGLSGLGMYVDSWAKAGIGNILVGGSGIQAPANPPQNNIDDITLTSDTFANHLLNDMIDPTFDSSGFAGIAMSFISTTGSAPAIAAGIRYGAVEGSGSRSFSHGWVGNETYDPGQLDLAAPTAATHRLAAVGLTRLEMNREAPYDKAILEFDISVDTSGNATVQEGDECADEAQVYGDCVEENGTSLCSPLKPSDDCRNLGTGAMPDFNTSLCVPPCASP